MRCVVFSTSLSFILFLLSVVLTYINIMLLWMLRRSRSNLLSTASGVDQESRVGQRLAGHTHGPFQATRCGHGMVDDVDLVWGCGSGIPT